MEFKNYVHAWGYFSKEKLLADKGKLLTLDIDFGTNCSLNCPHCFRKENNADNFSKEMLSFEELIEILKQGKELGLECVKFLGAGEPFEEPRFLDFLEELNKMNLTASIFTKGHVLGDDLLAKKYFEEKGINSALELCENVKALNASILLGFNSISAGIQDRMVGNIPEYTVKRNKALENLIQTGFNKENPTRLCLAILPITKENFDELFWVYIFARSINALPLITPPMVSGRCSDDYYLKEISVEEKKLIELYVKIYKWNIENGLQTFEQIKKEGISAYAGIHPCNQIACGMYITLNGTVLRCPGDDVTVFGNVREKSLKEIWENSENFGKWIGTFNCRCPPKHGKTMPENFYMEVMKKLEEESKNKE